MERQREGEVQLAVMCFCASILLFRKESSFQWASSRSISLHPSGRLRATPEKTAAGWGGTGVHGNPTDCRHSRTPEQTGRAGPGRSRSLLLMRAVFPLV